MNRVCYLVAVVLASGCATSEFVPTGYFELAPRVDGGEGNFPRLPISMGVHPLEYAEFYKQKFVYREADYVLAYDSFNAWTELPRDSITRALIDGLAASGRFSDVGYAYDLLRPELILTGELRRLDQVRASTPWTAHAEIRFELRNRLSGNILWARTLAAQRPLESQTPAAFAASLSEALSEILSTAVNEISHSIPADS